MQTLAKLPRMAPKIKQKKTSIRKRWLVQIISELSVVKVKFSKARVYAYVSSLKHFNLGKATSPGLSYPFELD